MSIQTKTMTVKSDTSLAETTTTIRDTVTFDVSNMPNGITYKGLKAVLSFADPIQWNKASTYDALTVVWDDASHGSYASKRPVPANIELTNEFYWLRTADLDAQVEMYRQEVKEMDGRVTANTEAIAKEVVRAKNAEQTIDAIAKKSYELVKAFSGKKAIVYGDSTAALKPSYMEMFGDRMGMEVDNRAISGTAVTPSTYSNPSDNSLYALLKNASQSDFSDTDYVFLCYSTNDWQGGAKLFDCGDETHQPSFERALSMCIEYLLNFKQTLRIVFVAPVFAHDSFCCPQNRLYFCEIYFCPQDFYLLLTNLMASLTALSNAALCPGTVMKRCTVPSYSIL